ncbi:MAG: hypothetical protein HQ542_13910, partial [Bacteroidia bacterium]|nr:hypothetical protein [Bacteroidia bacterium]
MYYLKRYFLILFVFPLLVLGQTDSISKQRQKSFIDKQYAKSYLTDARDIAISPIRWKTGQWIGVTAIVGTAVVLFTQDGNIQKWAQNNRTPALDQLSKYLFEPIGSGLYSLSALGILYGCGFIWNNDRAKITALKGVEAFLLAGMTAQIIKHLTHRHRPYQDDPPDPGMWEGPFQGPVVADVTVVADFKLGITAKAVASDDRSAGVVGGFDGRG